MALFHITERDTWEEAVATGQYGRSTRGATVDEVGFIHCSWRGQVAKVAAAVYRDSGEDLVVLRIDEQQLTSSGFKIRVEDGGAGEEFPHIYGGVIPVSSVTDVLPATFDSDGTFRF